MPKDNGVAARLREALDRSGMRGAELAEKLGRTRALVSHWMTGRRVPSRAELERIAGLLGVNRTWLLGETSASVEPESVVNLSQRPATEKAGPVGAWYYRPSPKDGRDFGNPNIFATPPDVETLVRELGQNSIDAPFMGATVHIRFALIELSKGGVEYRQLLDAIAFDELRRHIESAAHQRARVASKLREGLELFDEDDRLILLRIDDYGTHGLDGNEPDQSKDNAERRNPYAALVRNNLDSSKETPTAGGSYGLGKAVLWNCSDLSTVLFASRIPGKDEEGIRVVGKTELLWHLLDGEPYAGPGWFGLPSTIGHSLWLKDPNRLRVLQLGRDDRPKAVDASRAFGTSALILGFRDPEEETRPDVSDLLNKIATAAAKNFFPAMVRGKLSVSIEHIIDGRTVSTLPVKADDYVRELCEALRAHYAAEVTDELREPGDVTRRSISMRIPGTKPGAEEVNPFEDDLEAHCILVVRLAEEDGSTRPGVELPVPPNRVALLRGRLMVTRYLAKENIVGAPPFHALLLAGEAAGSEAPQVAAEQFLRLAEPPAHNDWKITDELRAKYKRGSKTALRDLTKRISDALLDAVKPSAPPGEEGPEELMRLLQLASGGVVEPPEATLRNIKADLVDGAWHIEADVHVNDREHRLRITPRLWIDVESGGAIPLPWESLEYQEGKNRHPVTGSFAVGPKPRSISFRGISKKESEGVIAALCRAKIDVSADAIPAEQEDS